MSRSLRTTDMQGERIVKQFLIRYFYDLIRKGRILDKIRNYSSIDQLEQQLQGIDTVLFLKNGDTLNIDEKCALKYINTALSTFAFEIQWSRYGQKMTGWLIHEKLKTQYYFLMWIKGRPILDPLTGKILEKYNYIQHMTIDDLTAIELFAINKQVLLAYLSKIGITPEKMLAQADRMIKNNIEQATVTPDIKYFYSGYLAEKPVNLVISKRLLRKLADAVFYITPDQIKRNDVVIYEAPCKI